MIRSKDSGLLPGMCLVALAVMFLSGSSWGAAFDLWAKDAYISTPDGNSIYIWGLTDSAANRAQLPAPTLVVQQGDTVNITLHNDLAEPVSLVFPGQDVVSSGGVAGLLAQEAPAAGGTVTYQFAAGSPGTYMYHSGTNVHKQVHMGIYGVIIVRPADWSPTNKTAYGAGTDTEFDREHLLITGELDPDLHWAVEMGEDYDIRAFKARYWTVNGRCFPDTLLPDNAAYLPNQPYGALIMCKPDERVLLRYVGVGMQNHVLHPHGNHTRVIAQDGQLLKGPAGEDLSTLNFTVLLGTGQTVDQIYIWSGLGYTPSNPIPTRIPGLKNLVIMDPTLYSGSPYLGVKGDLPVGTTSLNEVGEYYFMLHAHEELQITNWGAFPGGLMTLITVYPPDYPL